MGYIERTATRILIENASVPTNESTQDDLIEIILIAREGAH